MRWLSFELIASGSPRSLIHMDWESWSSWAAVAPASVAGWLALSAKRHEDARDTRQLERDRQEQAQLVAAWVREFRAGKHNSPRSWQAIIANTSGLPIFDVEATVGQPMPDEMLLLVRAERVGLIRRTVRATRTRPTT